MSDNDNNLIPRSGSEKPNYIDSTNFHVAHKMNLKKIEKGKCFDITIYAERARKWFLKPAQKLLRKRNSGFAVLSILFSYIESFQILNTGNSSKLSAGRFFKQSFNEIFKKSCLGNIVDASSLAWNKIRNGLYHNSITKRGAIIDYNINYAFELRTQSDGEKFLHVNPKLVCVVISNHHKNFINKLRTDSSAYSRFKLGLHVSTH